MCLLLIIPVAGCDLANIVGAAQEMYSNYEKGKEKLGDNYSIVYDIKNEYDESQMIYKRAGASYLHGNSQSAIMYDSSANKCYLIYIDGKGYSEQPQNISNVEALEGYLFGPYLGSAVTSLGNMKKDTSAKALDRNCIKYTFTSESGTTEYYIDKEYYIIVQMTVTSSEVTLSWKLKEIKVGGVKVSDFLEGFPGQYEKYDY